ncbi:MerR family transcriptional regulator [Rhodococcus sp. 05-2255-1e]|uniref:MerR family transcriptional regulator n=1 Tax=Rhodococcus sp. 05-2255-1e TaxID=2022495 RepID=UPI000B9C086A|nr:MerR family transcriptional regulator [Rhodococcus sp. 05-2255-1e]OZE24558.1 MerR family transcriptional regulator [Rhodococcus sp. 05-2255-1e]
MQIGEVARRAELSVRTVRHYEDVGLLMPSARTTGGFRLYTESDVDRLLVIRRMKPLGFTLSEMKELLDSLDVLDDRGASTTQRAAAAEFVEQCHAKVEDSVRRARRHLRYAEELTDLLDNPHGIAQE